MYVQTLSFCHELEAIALPWSSVPQYCWCLIKHELCIKFAVIVYKKAHMQEQQLHRHMACMCEAQSSNTIMSVFTGACDECGANVEYYHIKQCQSNMDCMFCCPLQSCRTPRFHL